MLSVGLVLAGTANVQADLWEPFNDGFNTNTPVTLEFFNSDPGAFFGVDTLGGVSIPDNPTTPEANDAVPAGGLFQVTTDGVTDNRNYAYFDGTYAPAPARIDFSMSLQIGPQEASADGGSISFISQEIFGSTGGTAISAFEVPEDPSQIGVLGIGFDTWANAGIGDGAQVGGGDGSAYNDVSLYFNGSKINQFYDSAQPDVLPNGVRIDDNDWHQVAGTVDFEAKTVSMSIDGLPVWENLSVPSLVPFSSRVMVGARTGGEDENFNVDNLFVDYSGEIPVTPPSPEQPAPTQGNWSVREWNVFNREVNGTAGADEIIADTSPEVFNSLVIKDGQVPIINFADPQGAGGGYSIPIQKTPFLTNTGGPDDDIVLRAIAKVIIPEDGQYTFGFDGDDGTRMTLAGADFTLQDGGGTAAGEIIEFPDNTGNAFTIASTFMPAGEHDIELVWQERGGGAFVEAFAAPGVKASFDAEFSPIGLKEEIFIAEGTLPTTSGDWAIRQVQVDPTFESSDEGVTGLNNITDAETAIGLSFATDVIVTDEFEHTATTLNIGDGGDNGRFQPDDQSLVTGDHWATQGLVTVSIPEDGDYIFGFGSDDGASLTLEGADFSILGSAVASEVTNDGQTILANVNTGNSDTYGTTFLTAGEYDLSFLSWERGGGAWAEVYTGVGAIPEAILTARLLGSPEEDFDLVFAPGLQLGGEGVISEGIPGDYNNSGQVEQGDLDFVLLNWGDTIGDPGSIGWTNDLPDGVIDQGELDGVLLNWGNTAAVASAAVPEPSTLAMLILVAAGLLATRFARR